LAWDNGGCGGGDIGKDKGLIKGGSPMACENGGCRGGDIGKDKPPPTGVQCWLASDKNGAVG